jgi:hypothetical protein
MPLVSLCMYDTPGPITPKAPTYTMLTGCPHRHSLPTRINKKAGIKPVGFRKIKKECHSEYSEESVSWFTRVQMLRTSA